jgi:hypothetical protein
MGKREKGFALMTVLIFFLVLLILGVGGAIITQLGFFSITSEVKYARAEKNANIGLMEALESGDCNDTSGGNTFEGYTVKTSNDTEYNYCFVWSEGRYWGAKVVKTSIFPLKRWAASMFRNLNNLNIGGSAAIVGYDPSEDESNCNNTKACIAPALVTGNNLNLTNVAQECTSNPKGIVSNGTTRPYKHVSNLNATDLTPKLFNAGNRTELLEKLKDAFQVSFDDDGTPKGLVEAKKPDSSVDSCTAEGITITCGERGNADIFTWNSEKGVYRYNKDGKDYSKIDFGNAQITFNSFSGGGYIAGKNINFNKDANVNPDSPLVLVARERITLSKNDNNINISNTFMFSPNYNIDAKDAKKITIGNGIIYSGGEGDGLTIDLRSDSKLGTQDFPVLIISDNQISISGSGNPDIWGLIFVTQNSYLNTGKGDFKIHGAIISNSLSDNNKIDLTGNFEIRFNFVTLENLANNLNDLIRKLNNLRNSDLLKTPVCNKPKNLFTLFTMRTY